jgi:energy-coupling factor transport system ATP-binding protein
MESIANYLTDEIKEELCEYQIDSLNRTITDYINQNKEARNVVWHVCPKCHTPSDDFAKGGYTQDKNGKRKKAMLKCRVCNHRFVKDHGQLTYYSHSDSSAWNKVIADTLDGHSLESTAAEIDRHIVTVFHMRHKFLSFVEAENESAVLSDTAETDEKYVHECHKGLVKADIDHEHKQITVYKQPRKKTSPGLSDDKACIFTAVQRQGRSFIHTENMGKPSTENARCLKAHIEEGTFVAILGTNGCGKSTLAKHFNSILLPSGGKVYVCGIDTSFEDRILQVRRNVGMVFQNPDNQIVANVVEEDVAFGPENLGVASPEIRNRVDKALKQVGMYEYREHAPHLLSGGQKQRIAIAGVIAMEPKCIVLDEPTAMLDPKGRREVIETIGRLNTEKKITVVLITHHMDEAAKADRVVVLHKGQVALDGTPQQVFSQVEKLHAIGLAAPETVELCYELNQQGFCAPLDKLEPEECARALYDMMKS